jgi:Kef-type K+ transport system membrane component KefB
MTPVEGLLVVAVTVAVAGYVAARLGVAASLVELTLGVVAAALLPTDPAAPWFVLLGGVAGVAVTFLAGSEIDTDALRRRPLPALALGLLGFAAPFAVVTATAWLALGWSPLAAVVAGAVLGETSLAVTYSVLLDLGRVDGALGRLLMAAVFVTDIAAAAVMTAVVTRPSWGLLAFAVGSVVVCIALPRLLGLVHTRAGERASEPGLRVVTAGLAVLLVLAAAGGGVAVLPAFVLGVACARYYRERPTEHARLRSVVMGFLAPFVFVRAGMAVSPSAVLGGLGAVALLVAAKVSPKALVSAAVLHRLRRGDVGAPATPKGLAGASALMSTGLTFGTVINLAALQAGLVDRGQFSVLAAAILVSALVPGVVGQRLLCTEPPAPGGSTEVDAAPRALPGPAQDRTLAQAAR